MYKMNNKSESFWLTIAGAAMGTLGLVLWYLKNTLMTSRCIEVSCCCLRIKNAPLSDAALEDVILHDHPPSLQPPQNGTTPSSR
jgi:hypothetical protein